MAIFRSKNRNKWEYFAKILKKIEKIEKNI